MSVSFQRFLAGAQARVIPNQTNQQVIKTLLDTLVPVIDLTAQSVRVQRAEASHTMVAAVKPTFTFPAVPIDEMHIYHFLALHNATSGGTQTVVVNIQYPQFADVQQELYQVDTGTMINLLAAASGSTSRSQRAGLPLRVFPEGILTVSTQGNQIIGDVIRIGLLRELAGGAALSEVITSEIADTEQ